MSKKKASVEKIQTSDYDLNTFESKLLALCSEYFINFSKSTLFITNRSQGILKKYREKQNLDKFEEAYINEYLLKSLDKILPKLLSKAKYKTELEIGDYEKNYQEQFQQEVVKKSEEQELLEKYGLKLNSCYVPPKEIIEILKKLDSDTRLSEHEAIWLNSIGEKFFNTQVRHKFHRLEANYFLNEYSQDPKNIWNAINASSHLRKCNESQEAEELLKKITINNSKEKTLASAYFTTLGGVRRDLKKMNIALDNASKAHSLNPKNYQPCTLLGAIYMEIGDYTLGDEWYEKASARGADTLSINAELKRIISNMDNVKRKEIIASLLKLDSHKYSWLASLEKTVVNKPTSKKNKDELLIKPQKKTPKPASRKSAQRQVTETPNSKQPMNQSKASSVKSNKK